MKREAQMKTRMLECSELPEIIDWKRSRAIIYPGRRVEHMWRSAVFLRPNHMHGINSVYMIVLNDRAIKIPSFVRAML